MHMYYVSMTSNDGLRLDAHAIRILAHPLRSRLLSHLRVDGPNTATGLAALLNTNTGATSYHLRKLESVGLVRDTGDGQGKRRLWEPTPDSTSWQPSDVEGDVDSETALGWLTRDYAHHFSEQYDRWLDDAASWPVPWQDACGSSDASVLVTAGAISVLVLPALASVLAGRPAPAESATPEQTEKAGGPGESG